MGLPIPPSYKEILGEVSLPAAGHPELGVPVAERFKRAGREHGLRAGEDAGDGGDRRINLGGAAADHRPAVPARDDLQARDRSRKGL